jgi:DNA-binding GntR family transcriptional regulator
MSLRGQADFLREEAMAAHFGIGRMLLRQTFSRLAGMGVIEHVPRRGWRIRPFEERDLHSFLEIRELLEIQALRSARENLEAPVLQQLQAANEPLTPDGPPRIDNSLHAYFIERAGNRFISSFFSQNGGYFRWLFDNATLEAHLIAEMACEHAAILKASLDRDWATAESILSKHIRAQGAIVQQLIAKVSG